MSDLTSDEDIVNRSNVLLTDLAAAHGKPAEVRALVESAFRDAYGPIVLACALNSMFGFLVRPDLTQPNQYRL